MVPLIVIALPKGKTDHPEIEAIMEVIKKTVYEIEIFLGLKKIEIRQTTTSTQDGSLTIELPYDAWKHPNFIHPWKRLSVLKTEMEGRLSLRILGPKAKFIQIATN